MKRKVLSYWTRGWMKLNAWQTNPKGRLRGGYFRDGPLEKLWGGRGIFEPQEFFFVIKFLVWIFFRPLREYFLGLTGVQEFFLIKFSLARIFLFVLHPPPPAIWIYTSSAFYLALLFYFTQIEYNKTLFRRSLYAVRIGLIALKAISVD